MIKKILIFLITLTLVTVNISAKTVNGIKNVYDVWTITENNTVVTYNDAGYICRGKQGNYIYSYTMNNGYSCNNDTFIVLRSYLTPSNASGCRIVKLNNNLVTPNIGFEMQGDEFKCYIFYIYPESDTFSYNLEVGNIHHWMDISPQVNVSFDDGSKWYDISDTVVSLMNICGSVTTGIISNPVMLIFTFTIPLFGFVIILLRRKGKRS